MNSRFAIPLGILALAVVSLRASAATWVSPSSSEPGGNVAPSLNTSSEEQTKFGGLTIQSGELTVTGRPLRVGGSPTELSKICFVNAAGTADCRSGWGEVVTNPNALSLFPQPYDRGYISLKGPTDSNFHGTAVNATVRGIAGSPTSTISTFGVLGEASSEEGEEGQSFGIQAQANVADNAALFAETVSGTLWGGYFSGSVLITDPRGGTCENDRTIPCERDSQCQGEGNSCIPFPSLIIGGNGPESGFRKDLGYICLAGVCKSEWPVISGAGYWTGTTTLQPKPEFIGRSLAVGGAGSSAPVTVAVTTDANYNPITADMSVRGNTAFGQYVVGTPPGNAPIITTCGDGKCTGLENGTIGSPYYCSSDCDSTPPGNVIPAQYLIHSCDPSGGWCDPNSDTCEFQVCKRNPDERCGFSYYCPRNPDWTFYLYWQNPYNSPDYAGVKVIIRNDRYPTGPDDVDNVYPPVQGFIAGPEQTGYEADCTAHHNRPYFVGMYSFDTSGNYSGGVLTWGVCTNVEVMIVEP
ncbi:MAG: hypothetical protein V1907_01975 [Candidatus Kerfeldbacteria bacterium]